MCDPITEAENESWLRKKRIDRRSFGLAGAGTAAALASGCAYGDSDGDMADKAKSGGKTISRTVKITTPDGECDAFFVVPKMGTHPAVLIWPDVAGLRPAFEQMATRLAESGYAVLAVNPYYRSAKAPILTEFSEWRTPEGQAKIKPMREQLTPDAIIRDATAHVAWLDRQEEVDTSRRIGTTGYCMGGPFTLRSVSAAPDRIGVIGSFHGGGLVTDADDSPHLAMAELEGKALICIAQNDDERDPDAKTVLSETALREEVPSDIDVYPAQHGWCVIDSPVYDREQAEVAWSKLLTSLEEYL